MNSSFRRTILLIAALIVPTIVAAADVYKVTVTRKDQDFYEVQGGKFYIKTRYCYEYVYFDEAILRIDSLGGLNIGKIMFSSGSTCDVEKVLQE